MFFRGTYESPRMAASISWPLLILGDVVSSAEKIKVDGSEFKFSIFRKLEEIII